MAPYRMRRVFAFLDPWQDPRGGGFQIIQSWLALGGGGLTGRGIGESKQKLFYLPEAHTDFIFAVLGEEFGLFGSLVVLAMIGILGYAGIRIATHADDLFVRYATGGITVWFMVQALINLAVVLRLLPIAGVPLPLVSYGGSALVANLLAVGVLLACARRDPDARKLLARKAMRPQPRMTTVVGSRTRQGNSRS
jgi:cell division protein FtsW